MTEFSLSRWLRIAASAASWAMTLGLALCLLASRWGAKHWTLDLLSHFHVQYLGFGIVAVAMALVGKARWGLIAAALVAFAAGREVAPLWSTPGGDVDTSSPQVRVVALNVLTMNRRREDVTEWLLEQRADVLVIQEVDEGWAQALDDGLVGFRRLATDTLRSDNFGIAIYLSDAWGADPPVVHLTDLGKPWIEAVIHGEDGDLRVIAIHTIPPVRAYRFRSRNEQVAAAVGAAADSREPALILGDFNATIWSAALREVLPGSGLRPACLGFGLRGTWHSRLLWTGGILIDHVLVDERLAVLSHSVGRHVGSDHRGVVVDVAVR